MTLTLSEILNAQIGHPERKQINVKKTSLGIDPITAKESFRYDFINPPANYLLYCDVIEPELVCLVVDLDYAPAV